MGLPGWPVCSCRCCAPGPRPPSTTDSQTRAGVRSTCLCHQALAHELLFSALSNGKNRTDRAGQKKLGCVASISPDTVPANAWNPTHALNESLSRRTFERHRNGKPMDICAPAGSLGVKHVATSLDEDKDFRSGHRPCAQVLEASELHVQQFTAPRCYVREREASGDSRFRSCRDVILVIIPDL